MIPTVTLARAWRIGWFRTGLLDRAWGAVRFMLWCEYDDPYHWWRSVRGFKGDA